MPAHPAVPARSRRRPSGGVPTPSRGGDCLCNGVVVFDDTGELLPDGRSLPAHRACCARAA
ncbi:DUF5999 family protein [Microbispora sp. CA-135349]|uniref:DUF5999 family protein n=1 Tax=Microbispora sp. CA-135349 TaxID=3239953 RepID=UPI003D8A2EEC